MKKIFAITLIICMVLSLCVVASAEGSVTSGPSTLTVNGVLTGKLLPGYASIETSFTNTTDKDVSITMIMAEYTKTGEFTKMVSSGVSTKVIPAGKTVIVNPGLNVTSKDANLKYFAYVSGTLQPVAVENYYTQGYEFIGTNNDETIYRIITFKDLQNVTVDNTNSESLVSPVITTWEDGKASAYSITMDDGVYASALDYLKLFKKYNVHGTEMMKGDNVTNGTTMYTSEIKKWQDIFDTGYIDAGNHSFNHSIKYNSSDYTQAQLEHDIIDSYKVLKEAFPTQSIITFATPWGNSPTNAINVIKKNHYANRNAGGGVVSGKTPSDFYQLPTYAVQYGTPAATLNQRTDAAISSGGWNIELYHAVGGAGTDSASYSTNLDSMETHLKYVYDKRSKVWGGSFTEVVKYIYERDTASAKRLWATKDSIGLMTTDKVDDDIFDYPLTVKLNVPSAWTGSITVTQGNRVSTASIFTEGGLKYAYAHVVPDKEIAVVTKTIDK